MASQASLTRAARNGRLSVAFRITRQTGIGRLLSDAHTRIPELTIVTLVPARHGNQHRTRRALLRTARKPPRIGDLQEVAMAEPLRDKRSKLGERARKGRKMTHDEVHAFFIAK
jgi:hypothetical protein